MKFLSEFERQVARGEMKQGSQLTASVVVDYTWELCVSQKRCCCIEVSVKQWEISHRRARR